MYFIFHDVHHGSVTSRGLRRSNGDFIFGLGYWYNFAHFRGGYMALGKTAFKPHLDFHFPFPSKHLKWRTVNDRQWFSSIQCFRPVQTMELGRIFQGGGDLAPGTCMHSVVSDVVQNTLMATTANTQEMRFLVGAMELFAGPRRELISYQFQPRQAIQVGRAGATNKSHGLLPN